MFLCTLQIGIQCNNIVEKLDEFSYIITHISNELFGTFFCVLILMSQVNLVMSKGIMELLLKLL